MVISGYWPLTGLLPCALRSDIRQFRSQAVGKLLILRLPFIVRTLRSCYLGIDTTITMPVCAFLSRPRCALLFATRCRFSTDGTRTLSFSQEEDILTLLPLYGGPSQTACLVNDFAALHVSFDGCCKDPLYPRTRP